MQPATSHSSLTFLIPNFYFRLSVRAGHADLSGRSFTKTEVRWVGGSECRKIEIKLHFSSATPFFSPNP